MFKHETHHKGGKSFPSLPCCSTGTLLSGRSLQGTRTDEHEAGRAEEPWGMANCPQASPSPLTRRLQAENWFPSVCPDIPSAPRLFPAEQCCAFTIDLRGADTPETHREAAARALFHSPQPATTAISWHAHFSNPHLFGNPDYHYLITKEAQVKRSLAGRFPTLPSLALLIKCDSHRQNFIKKHSLSHLYRNSVTIKVFP